MSDLPSEITPAFNEVTLTILKKKAKSLNIRNRSKMNKRNLYNAIYQIDEPPKKLKNIVVDQKTSFTEIDGLDRIMNKVNRSLASTSGTTKGQHPKKTRHRTIVDDYFDFLEEYQKLYGKRTCILMEVGAFFELYSIELPDYKRGNAREIANVLNILVTRKSKKEPHNISNPLMAGITSVALDKYLKILIKNCYTVVLVEQVTPPPHPKRRVTKVLSPATYMDENNTETNNLMTIYLDHSDNVLCCGIGVIDVSTGESKVYEVHNKGKDTDFVISEITRFVLSNQPKEILIHTINFSKSNNELINMFNLSGKMVIIKKNELNMRLTKISYQNDFLGRIFKETGFLSPIEWLNMERLRWATTAYVILLDYAYKHNETIISNLRKPCIANSSRYLRLDNNTIVQLNIIPMNREYSDEDSCKYHSLFEVVNFTKTVMGRRLLKSRILNPIIDKTELKSRYAKIASLYSSKVNTVKKQEFSKLEMLLVGIPDLERIHRRLSLKMLHPQEFSVIDDAYSKIPALIKYCLKNKDLKDMVSNISLDTIKNFIKYYKSCFDIPKMNYNISKIEQSFFKKGYSKEIDDLQNSIDNGMDILEEFRRFLDDLIDGKSRSKYVKLKFVNGRYYFAMTRTRSNILTEALLDVNEIKIKTITLDKKLLKLKRKNAQDHIAIHPEIELIIENILESQESMKEIAREVYLDFIGKIFEKYKHFFRSIEIFISELDFFYSGAKCAWKNRYICPEILESDENISSFNMQGLRHPIVEKINDQEKYVENNVRLDNNIMGLVLSGVNGSGKSCFLKAIGSIIITAQMGYFVSCRKMTYIPFSNILTRILGTDNMFLRKSSFETEMNELKQITNRGDQNSLVLIDELCKGTEHRSATGITASSIDYFTKKLKIKFILTTHNHKIFEIDEVKKCTNIEIKHLKISFGQNGEIIYDRRLEDGMCKTTYGIEIARKLGLDDQLIKKAEEIRKRLVKKPENLMLDKRSKYNVKKYVKECEICKEGSNLETHHIKEQHESNQDGHFDDVAFHKNSLFNLVVLCKKHHLMVHSGKVKIVGKMFTSDGFKLVYNMLNGE